MNCLFIFLSFIVVPYVTATLREITALPYNVTQSAGFIQPMQQVLVQGGSTTGALTDEGVIQNTFVQLNSKQIQFRVDLVEQITTLTIEFNPAISIWLDVGVADATLIANQSLLYPNPQGANIATLAQDFASSEPDPASSSFTSANRRLLALGLTIPNVTGLEAGPSDPPAVANPGPFLSNVDCSGSSSTTQIMEAAGATAAIGVAVAGPVGLLAGLVGGLAAAYLGGNSAKVACQVAVNSQWVTTQSNVLSQWLGLDGNYGAFTSLNASNNAAYAFENKANTWVDVDNQEWATQDNFTQNQVNSWLSLYNTVLQDQKNATEINANILQKIDDYTTQQFSQLYSNMDTLNENIDAMSANFELQAELLNNTANNILGQQTIAQTQLSNIYGMFEVLLDQMNAMLIALAQVETLQDERRGMVLAWIQSVEVAITMRLKVFSDPSSPGIIPHSAFPPIHELTYADVEGLTPRIPEGTGDNFDHYTIVYTQKQSADFSTEIIADEFYIYVDQDFALEGIQQWFNTKDIQTFLAANGSCYSPSTCNLWLTKYSHSCQAAGAPVVGGHAVQYTLNNPLDGVNNPPSYILGNLLACTPQSGQTFPGDVNAPASFNMQKMYSVDTFNAYLASICSSSTGVGPIYLYSWMESKAVLVQRNSSLCSTSYRQMDADAADYGMTFQRAFYHMIQDSLQITLLNNTFRELYKYGAIPDHVTSTHIPFIQRPDALRTQEQYIASFVATEFTMTPVYYLTPIDIVTEAIVEDSGGSTLVFNIPAREDFTIPLGDGFVFFGFLECLFQPVCGNEGTRFFYDVPPFSTCSGVSYAPLCANKVDYINAPAVVQASGARYTYNSPLPTIDLGDWLADKQVSFDASQATTMAAQFYVKVYPVYPDDLTRQHILTCDPNNTAAWNEMCLTFQDWGIITDNPGQPEETTVLSFVPLVWEARVSFAQQTTEFALPPPFYEGCPFVNNINIQQVPGTLAQMYVWNNLATPIFIDIVYTADTSGDGADILSNGSPCEMFISNTTINADETQVFTVPACATERIIIWQAGLRAIDDQCYQTVLNTLGLLPNTTGGAAVITIPPYINNTVLTITSATDVAIWSMGRVVSGAIDGLQTSISTAAITGALVNNSEQVFAGIIADTQINQVLLAWAAQNTSNMYDQTQQVINQAQVDAAAVANSTTELIAEINAFEAASKANALIISESINNTIGAELDALTNQLDVLNGQFSSLLAAAKLIPPAPPNWQPQYGNIEALSNIADSVLSFSETEFEALTVDATNLLENGVCLFTSIPVIGPLLCGGLGAIFHALLVVFIVLVTVGIIALILYLMYEYVV